MLSIESLFDAFHNGVALGCGFMENIIQPAGNLAFCHIVWNSDAIESRKLPLRQIGTKYQPPIILSLNTNVPSKNVVYKHMKTPVALMGP